MAIDTDIATVMAMATMADTEKAVITRATTTTKTGRIIITQTKQIIVDNKRNPCRTTDLQGFLFGCYQ